MKTLLILFVCFIGIQIAHAQNFSSSIGISGGYVEDGYGINASFNFHPNRYSFIQIGVFASFSEEEFRGAKVPYNIFSLQPAYFWRIFFIDKNKPLAVYFGGGAILGQEVVNKGKSELNTGALINAESKFIYGGFAGIEIEWILNNNFSLSAKINEHLHANSDIGKIYPYAGLGLRYYLY